MSKYCRCINANPVFGENPTLLTKGRIYEVTEVESRIQERTIMRYKILNDKGEIKRFLPRRFEDVSDIEVVIIKMREEIKE